MGKATDWGTGYIDDGYTVDGYIAGVERLHPPCRFKYRQMLVKDRGKYLQQMAEGTGESAEILGAKICAKHLQQWDIKDRAGRTVPISPDACLRVQPQLAKKIFSIIIGERSSDPDPNELEEDSESGKDSELESLRDFSVEEQEEKN